jgi:hypothetical protein
MIFPGSRSAAATCPCRGRPSSGLVRALDVFISEPDADLVDEMVFADVERFGRGWPAPVAEGLTNQEIADRLAISPRAVSTHIDHILPKPGFSNRVQIATWVTRL